MRRWIGITVGFIILALAFGAFLKQKKLFDGDPDRYYHFALSKITAQSGHPYLRSLPQVEDLGWGDNFIDKEFLFHEITTLGYVIAGERGVEESSFLCAILALLVFYLFAAHRLPVPAAMAISFLTFSSPFLAFRLALLRPHTLAILTFLLMNTAIMARKPKLTGLACFLFVLSYHAFYVPLMCMSFLFGLSYLDIREAGSKWRRLSLMGAIGCLAGLLANPYFPGNILLAAIHARIPELMQGEMRGVSFGEELVPVRADHHLQIFHGPMFVLFFAMFMLGLDMVRRDPEGKALRVRLLYLLGLAGFFLGVSFQIIRAGEYLIPACGLVLVLLLERWKEQWKLLALGTFALGIAQVFYVQHLLRELPQKGGPDRVHETFRAIEAIPLSAKGAKVFNCEWDRTPYLLYARPDLRFIDILDPSLLYFANSGAFRSREEFRQGTVADALGLLRNAFHSDYVICGDAGEVTQMRLDPGFQQIYPLTMGPNQSNMVLSVFRILPEPSHEFARALELTEPSLVTEGQLAALEPPADKTGRKIHPLGKSTYLNLATLLPLKRDGGGIHCAFISPAESDVQRLEGARYLGLGGGQGFKVWKNGKRIFTSRTGFSTTKIIQVFVPLGTPLRRTDKIDVLACSSPSAPFWGVAISLWTKEGIGEACRLKSASLAPQPTDISIWPYQGLQSQTCLGPIAAPAAEIGSAMNFKENAGKSPQKQAP